EGSAVFLFAVRDVLLRVVALSSVDEYSFYYFRCAILPLKQAHICQHPKKAAISSAQAQLKTNKGTVCLQARDELLCRGHAGIEFPHGARKDFVPGGISEEAREGFVAIQHVAVTATAENPGRIPLKERPVALLRCPVRSFPSLALSDWPQEVLICQVWSLDRKSTRLNSSHGSISYAVFCLK